MPDETSARSARRPVTAASADWRKFAAARAASLAAVAHADASIIYTKPTSPEVAAMP